MRLTIFPDARSFLAAAGEELNQAPSANNLMLGLANRLQQDLHAYGNADPFLATVSDAAGLILIALMTPPYNLVLHGARPDIEEACDLLIPALLEQAWVVPGVLGRTQTAYSFAEQWTKHTRKPFSMGMHQRIYELRKVIHPAGIPGKMRLANTQDFSLVQRWSHMFVVEAIGEREPQPSAERIQQQIEQQEIFLWEVDKPVSLAGTARPVAGGITIGRVFTPPENRCRGYATALVAVLSQHLLDAGYQFCNLFTNLANPISNSIYMRIGYQAVCDFDLYRFEE